MLISFFFFNDTATTEIYTLSLHDALPISFAAARIEVVFHEYENPVYPQRHGDFAPFLSRSEEHTSELQSQSNLVCRLLLEKKKRKSVTCVGHQLRAKPCAAPLSGPPQAVL